ncbi:MAG TPA: histidine phosphatase family protein [Armatimonadota bacterium]|jgi:broad specificity phosphatase PhoE
MDIYLIRHGESTGNSLNCFLGWSDHPLTERGQAQAQAIAGRLAPLGPMPVWCSDLPRARQTAEAVVAPWGGTVTEDARWREICSGAYEGRPWDAFTADQELSQRFDADPFHTPMPEGESVAIMAARVREAFAACCAAPIPRLAVVTHDGPIRAVLAHCLGIPPERFWTLATTHGALTHLTLTEGWLSVRCVNDASHLGALA